VLLPAALGCSASCLMTICAHCCNKFESSVDWSRDRRRDKRWVEEEEGVGESRKRESG
jgi:hypothetical protein